MTPHREQYLDDLVSEVSRRLRSKYRAGQEEHGGDLDRKACLPMLGEEIVDAVVYHFEFRRRLMKWRKCLNDAVHGSTSWEYAVSQVIKGLDAELRTPTTDEVYDD